MGKINNMKKVSLLFFAIMLFSLASCSFKTSKTTHDTSSTVPIEDAAQTAEQKEDEYMSKKLELRIDNQIIDVIWLDNPSVTALKELAKDGLTISMHEYGGFEQTGMIGSIIASNDSKIDVIPGDIVLYNSNQISIFYNSSSWSYTKLGHINLIKTELQDLLDTDQVSVTLTLK